MERSNLGGHLPCCVELEKEPSGRSPQDITSSIRNKLENISKKIMKYTSGGKQEINI
jgi:hypothetical protein